MILLSSFVLGLVFGSFLNVVIFDLKNGVPLQAGRRSFCPNCKTQLKWHDLIPVLSFIFLCGRCRYCHKKISWQYPVVEILSGFIWVAVFWKIFGLNLPLVPPLIKGGIGGVVFDISFLNFIYYIFIFSAFLIIAVYDLKWRIIPDKIVYPAIAVVLIYNIFLIFQPPLIPLLTKEGMAVVLNFAVQFFVASAAFLFFFFIYYFSGGRAMGLGDAKLAFLIGLFLTPLPAIAALTLAFIVGAAFGIMLLALGKATLKKQIAFGPFLVLGATIAFLCQTLLSSYLF